MGIFLSIGQPASAVEAILWHPNLTTKDQHVSHSNFTQLIQTIHHIHRKKMRDFPTDFHPNGGKLDSPTSMHAGSVEQLGLLQQGREAQLNGQALTPQRLGLRGWGAGPWKFDQRNTFWD